MNPTIALRTALLGTAIAAFISCVKSDGGPGSGDVSTDASEPLDASEPSGSSRDVRQAVDTDVQPSGQCDPNCHWDCFGGAPRCEGGKVWAFGFGPRSCCKSGDAWPGSGPLCSLDPPRLTCPHGCKANASYCLGANRPIEQIDPASLSVLCETNDNTDAGNPSAVDANKVAGPDSSAFGQSCGLTPSPTLSLPAGVSLTKGQTCDLCLVRNEGAAQSCLAQVCTRACVADQDCPQGATCRCMASPDQNGKAALRLLCVPAALRNETEVFAWPKCG